MEREWDNAYYVLSCLSQFTLPASPIFYNALAFGLFRPLASANAPVHEDQQYTIELLSMIAFQLRMLRRRSVIPTLASLGVFLIAFVISVALAFAEIGENRTGSPLVLGLLYCWLPLLVIFTIVDRNPVSSERSA
jgi:hypothetical protein